MRVVNPQLSIPDECPNCVISNYQSVALRVIWEVYGGSELITSG